MGLFFEFFGRGKKRCTVCGCRMMPEGDEDICEVCLAELYASEPGEVDNEAL